MVIPEYIRGKVIENFDTRARNKKKMIIEFLYQQIFFQRG